MKDNLRDISLKLEKSVTEENIVLSNTNSISYGEYKDLLEKAEVLDGEDQFDHLYIAPESYAVNVYKNAQGIEQKIGIEYDNIIHRSKNCPIYTHQEKAARRFLKNFRGVGILADEVGMGKTIEAGMIMSELAERKLISSVLIVAASLDNLKNWVKELGEKFGLFPLDKNGNFETIIVKNKLSLYKNIIEGKPRGPILMNMSDFNKMAPDTLNEIVFDLIIFDEAHNLDESDEGKAGMKVLNKLMQNKKKVGKPYCILLSGTPHKGNLDSMFPLWYFMKNEAFQTKDDALRHYKNYLCHGASTMAEFIQYFKEKHLRNNTDFLEFKKEEIDLKCVNDDTGKMREYFEKNDYSFMQQYLKTEKGEKALEEIKKDARKNYYSLIDSFMIRQPRKYCNAGGVKTAHNFYFLPLYQGASFNGISITWGGTELYSGGEKTLELMNTNFTNQDAIRVDGRLYSIDTYLDKFLLSKFRDSRRSYQGERNKILFEFMSKANAFKTGFNAEGETNGNRYCIDKFYYQKSFSVYNENVSNDFVVVNHESNDEVLSAKASKFVEIVKKIDEQIIVFFDEEQDKSSDEITFLVDYLKTKEPSLFERVIIDLGEGDQAKDFQNNPKGILFASKKLAESSNFQFCHIIINFSISKSPIIMDQKIGRIDRIGQTNNMDIYTFARLDKIDGYITSLFNEIDLFSGWKNDIILVTGCDNKNAKIKICDNCQSILRDVNDSVKNCPTCGGVLNVLKVTDNYSCTNNNCSFIFTRKLSFDKEHQIFSQGASYQCLQNVKLELAIDLNGNEVYTCPKSCLITHCQRNANKPCLVACAEPGSRLNHLNLLCESSCKNHVCESCDVTINVYGRDIETGEIRTKKPCYTCESKPKCFFEFNVTKPECPYCGEAMKAIVPSTFDEFVKYLWDNSQFVNDYLNESYKVKEIVEILGDRDEMEG